MLEMDQIAAQLMTVLHNQYGELCVSVVDLLRRAAQDAPMQAAILEPDCESLTYGQLFAFVTHTVQALHGAGFTAQCRIAVALPTTDVGAVASLVVLAGMTLVPLSPELPSDDCERYLRHARVDAVLVLEHSAAGAVVAATHLGLRVIPIQPSLTGPVGLFELVGIEPTLLAVPQWPEPDAIAVIMLTSGTTSLPKMVPWTQRQLLLNNYISLLPFGASRHIIINMMPLYHSSGFSQVMISVVAQCGMTCLPTFNIGHVYRCLALYQPERVFAVPAMLQALVDEAASYETEIQNLHIKKFVTGSAALPEASLHTVERVFGVSVELTYGMTEVPSIAHTVQNQANPLYRAGSVGQPVRITQVKIVDGDGALVQAGASGEILLRSPLMFTGYLDNPAANAEAFDADWFRTGDVGYLDADGYLYLTGRVKEVINRGGSKVSPLDVEAVLVQHPAVVEVAAFGFPHTALGEDLAAAVVVRDAAVTERELRLFAAQRLPMNQVPSRFVFVSELPKTAVGKIKRNTLSEQWKTTLQR